MNDNIHLRKHYLPRNFQFQPTVARIREFFLLNASVVKSEFVAQRSGFDFVNWRCWNVHGASCLMLLSLMYETEKMTIVVKGIQDDSDLPDKLFGTLRDFLVAGTNPQIVGVLNEPGNTAAHKYQQPEVAKISGVKIDWGKIDIARFRSLPDMHFPDGRGGYKSRVRPANERMYIFNTAFLCPPDSTHDTLKRKINGFLEINRELFRSEYDEEISDLSNSGWHIYERRGEPTHICVELFQCNEFWMVEVHCLSGNRELFYEIYDTLRAFLRRETDDSAVDYSYVSTNPLVFHRRHSPPEPVYTEEERLLIDRIIKYMTEMKNREYIRQIHSPLPTPKSAPLTPIPDETPTPPPASWFWCMWFCLGGWLEFCMSGPEPEEEGSPLIRRIGPTSRWYCEPSLCPDPFELYKKPL